MNNLREMQPEDIRPVFEVIESQDEDDAEEALAGPPPKAEPNASKQPPQGNADGAKGTSQEEALPTTVRRRCRGRWRSTTAADPRGLGQVVQVRCSWSQVMPSGRQCHFSRVVCVYRQWGNYNRAVVASRGRAPSPARRAG